jgi:putative peptidoglycan lipid II flippase
MGTAAAVVGGGVLLSRILGLVREGLIAGLIGVSAETDLYRQAFAIPDFLSYLLAGAYLTITLIPILSRHLENHEPEKANQAFTSVFRFVGLAIVGLTLVMWILTPQIVELVFPAVPDQAALISLTRIALPAQIFLVLGSVLMAAQYTHKRFVIPALAPVIYNLGIIGGGLLGWAMGDPSPESFLWGAVAGSAVGNFGLQWIGTKRTSTHLVPVERGNSAVGEYLTLALPLMLGQSVAVLDEQFVRWFGQLGDTGDISALSFARQLNMVPIGVIAQAAGVAAYPFLARLAAGNKVAELNETTERAARNTMFVASAATALLVVLATPLVNLIYRYGQFSAEDAALVSSLLVIYAFSIPAWGLHQLLSRHFYAKRKMWTPVGIGTAATVVAIPTWILLHNAFGVEGFALASTLIMVVYALSLLLAWGADAGWDAVRRVGPAFGRGVLSAAIAAVVAIPLVDRFDLENMGVLANLGVALLGAITALAVFLGIAFLLRTPELALLRRPKPVSEV